MTFKEIPRFEKRELTRDEAAQLLKVNLDNRGLKVQRLGYARDMSDGEWRPFAPGAIIVLVSQNPETGEETIEKLEDGQNRLEGFLNSSLDVFKCWLFFTDDPTLAEFAVDSGVPRTFTDVLRKRKVPNAPLLTKVSKLLVMTNFMEPAQGRGDPYFVPGNQGDGWYPGDPENAPRPPRLNPTRSEMAAAFHRAEKNGLVAAGERGRVLSKRRPLRHLRPESITLVDYLLHTRDPLGAQDFWAAILSPNTIEDGHPCQMLFDLLDERVEKEEPRYSQRVEIAYLLKAWKLFREYQRTGSKPGKLVFSPGLFERFPELAA